MVFVRVRGKNEFWMDMLKKNYTKRNETKKEINDGDIDIDKPSCFVSTDLSRWNLVAEYSIEYFTTR